MTAKTIVLTSFAAAMMLTTAATAAPVDTVAAAATVGKPVAKTSRVDNPDQRYCIVDEVTGSRIPHRACNTLSGWQTKGIDPRQLPRR